MDDRRREPTFSEALPRFRAAYFARLDAQAAAVGRLMRGKAREAAEAAKAEFERTAREIQRPGEG